MKIAGTVQDSIVDGPGLRFTVFTQGCLHNCKGCQNPETHDINGGKEMEAESIIAQLLSNPLTDGVTLSGGEPFLQAEDCAEIAKAAKENGLNVWTYTGYTFEELYEKSKTESGIRELLSFTDVLVDGKFILEQRSLNVKWRGSGNQRVINCNESMERGFAVEAEI